MDTKELIDALDRIEGKMAETSKSNEAEMKRLGDEQVKLARQFLELQQLGVKAQQNRVVVKSVGDQFVGADSFKSFSAGSAPKMHVEISEFKDTEEGDSGSSGTSSGTSGSTTATAADPITTPTGRVVQGYRRPGILPGAFRPLTIESLFPTINIATNAFEYVQEDETKNVNGAAFVAEGAQKPFGSTNFELKTGNVRTIAHLARISKQLLADGPALAAYINQRIVYGVDLVVEDQLVSGDGTGQNLSGILTTGNYTPHGATKAALGGGSNITLFDLVLYAKSKVEQAFFRPNVILFNPADWTTLQMLKNSSGDYYLGHPASVAPKYLWGLPVWTTPAISQGQFLVGDFNQAATLWTRQGMVVEAFEQDQDNVEKNLVTIRAERRLGFGVERPSALCGGALTLPTA